MSTTNNIDNNAINMADEFLDSVFKPYFPKVKYKSKFTMSGESSPTSFKGELSKDCLFDETNYKLEPKNEFIHFTTLQGLDSILESGYLRLSSIENLTDDLEMTLALNKFKENIEIEICDEDITNIKQNIFCLSSCLNTPETISDTYLWENYSKAGSGAAIIFEVENVNPNLLFGKVQYGNNKLSVFEQLTSKIVEFKSEFEDFMPDNLYEMMSNIFCFHKANKFHRENEVRLLISDNKYSIYHEHNNLFIEKVINGSNELRYIYKLVLEERIEDWYNKNYSHRKDITIQDAHSEIPKISIKKIILGYNVKEPWDIIDYLIKKKVRLNMNFEVEYLNNELKIIK